MKKLTIPMALFLGMFLSNLIFAADFDATGLWDYSQNSHANNCGEPNPGTISGVAGILQTGNSFLFVDLIEGFSTFGSISSATYNLFPDQFCEDSGVVTTDVDFTLSSATRAAGPVNWTWTDGQNSCSGSFQLDLTKRPQNNPIFDASGKWNYTQSGFFETCVPSSTPPASSGFFQVTQTGNSVTAIDDQGILYSGVIDGATYSLVRTFPIDGGRTSVVYLVTLNSATSGSGPVEFVWDDNCDDCWGQWTIVVTKEPAAKQKSQPGIPLLLLED